MHIVTLVTKEGCHLCDKVVEVLLTSPSRHSYELRLSDLGSQHELERSYLLRIPVVLVDGAEAFEAKEMDLRGSWIRKLEDILAGLAREP